MQAKKFLSAIKSTTSPLAERHAKWPNASSTSCVNMSKPNLPTQAFKIPDEGIFQFHNGNSGIMKGGDLFQKLARESRLGNRQAMLFGIVIVILEEVTERVRHVTGTNNQGSCHCGCLLRVYFGRALAGSRL